MESDNDSFLIASMTPNLITDLTYYSVTRQSYAGMNSTIYQLSIPSISSDPIMVSKLRFGWVIFSKSLKLVIFFPDIVGVNIGVSTENLIHKYNQFSLKNPALLSLCKYIHHNTINPPSIIPSSFENNIITLNSEVKILYSVNIRDTGTMLKDTLVADLKNGRIVVFPSTRCSMFIPNDDTRFDQISFHVIKNVIKDYNTLGFRINGTIAGFIHYLHKHKDRPASRLPRWIDVELERNELRQFHSES